MDFQWIAIGLNEVAWVSVAFVLGLAARLAGLPPLVGFLATGFLLANHGIADGQLLQKLSDLGITLLLFTVGLKLNLRTLARPQVWAVTTIHSTVVVALFSLLGYVAAIAGAALFSDLDLAQCVLIAFALSFSSTVFVVKALEGRGEMTSLHGRISIGILLMQDVAAVIFLAVSSATVPSVWALLLLLLVPARPLLQKALMIIGHGELLVLYGFLLALGGAELFELVGLKGDLGALVLGVLIAAHPKAEELSKAMLGFKDLFLLGFFVSIGLTGFPGTDALLTALVLAPLVLLKSALFFLLLTRFRLRARTSFMATLNLSNYSEFGLIVAAIGVSNAWLSEDWMATISIALSLSFVVAAVLGTRSSQLYNRFHETWTRHQRSNLIDDDRQLELGGATIAIIGMGGVGTGTYDTLRETHGDVVIGVDIDPVTARNQRAAGRNVIRGDPSDQDFWDRVEASHTLQRVMLALPSHATTLAVLECLRCAGFSGHIAATARFDDQAQELLDAGAHTVFNMYARAGAGFAAHVERTFDPAG